MKSVQKRGTILFAANENIQSKIPQRYYLSQLIPGHSIHYCSTDRNRQSKSNILQSCAILQYSIHIYVPYLPVFLDFFPK